MNDAGDARLIGNLIARGCDMTEPRQVGIHFYAPAKDRAEALAAVLDAEGLEPHIFEREGEWLVAGLKKWMIVSQETIAELRQSSEDLAKRHGATFHGWQASLDPGMDV